MMAEFSVLDADVPHDRDEWIATWNQWPSREVSAHPGYLELFRRDGERALAAVLRDESGGHVLYPFLLRPVPSDLGLPGFNDITSAYGYGGPAYWGTDSRQNTAVEFWPLFDEWAASHDVVSEFIRFGLFGAPHIGYPGRVVERQPNVIVPIDADDDVLWSRFEHKVRKNVKRARSSGVEVVVDTEGERIGEFLEVYQSTMDRRDAAERYYFERRFFNRIHAELSGQFAYFHAYREGRVISTELVLLSEEAAYSYLGGTEADSFPFRPNDLLKYEIMRWTRDQGKRAFVLGGGVTAGDGIERYKRAFAPGHSTAFQTGERVLLGEVYESLIERRRGNTDVPENFFPGYRA
ncbi:GNAT family N-acetyltransferase [Microbacterium petrolearium]